ncbi:MAG: hypothetical protein V2J55_14840 [Candidatus Competibacteraceae bacterium]|nr:hypothetical protein [Candidatus Competibacteraceae bacterium]
MSTDRDGHAHRIAYFPAETDGVCKPAANASIGKIIEDALREEADCLYQATSRTSAMKRLTAADVKGIGSDTKNQ